MKKIVIVFGLIAGCIVSASMLVSIAGCYSSGNFEGNMLLGYASMILAFSLIFVGIKSYRDKQGNGFISFGKAFKIGVYISLVASTMYVAAWLVDYYAFIPDFMDKYTLHVIQKAQASGAGAAEVADKIKQIRSMQSMYNSFLGVVLLTYMEILPVGLVVSLISALILKRKANNGTIVIAP
ncbi:DUF4199 domain-containing protein [Mucilaginibacter phyllosphaerae]|uniref:DUF4199 domain-containing protein n=1 Tax=Mucilaginibacter phyllosphaerae TaxID=1812349 RepID=A0A4Y8AIZ3_9SPHI|nr:DUF4199 domain-containing protein [Mucilaginibacter phyllosphaerae]MBB3968381.1 ethanolamine transporter EutH [Mucilaginibacter phyllosphaerae]TEW68622.1 DUF4199 domain-containing protein [Mucilaginibacter phyllosphaerae]GGG99320.1 hypothetical protein GCM10007352_00110 [Mucilaginibacter phyllosphaerae]